MGHHKALPLQAEPFKAGPIMETEPPTGTEGSDWHRYVITQGGRTIVGYRRGSQRNVRLAIEEIVVQLNQRRLDNSGRAHLVSPRRKRE